MCWGKTPLCAVFMTSHRVGMPTTGAGCMQAAQALPVMMQPLFLSNLTTVTKK
jgi:hypothetical protein